LNARRASSIITHLQRSRSNAAWLRRANDPEAERVMFGFQQMTKALRQPPHGWPSTLHRLLHIVGSHHPR
jgi:hypothetical protein